MKSINADLNRRGPNGTVQVAMRRFQATPHVGEHFIVNDGEDKFEGTVVKVLADKRFVLLQMAWESSQTNHAIQFAVSMGDPGARSNGDRPLATIPIMRPTASNDWRLATV